MDIENFWERVRDQIKAHKINLRIFAEYIGIPVSTLYGWIHHNRSVEVITAYNIATALGVSLEYLLTGADGKSTEERMKQTEIRKNTEARMKKLVGKLHEEVGKL